MITSFRNLLARFGLNQTGVIAVEFAIIFPTVILMFFGMLDLTQFITVNRRVANAAGVVADLVTANDLSVTNAQIADYYYAAYMNLEPIPAANIRVEVYNFRSVSGTPALLWSKNSTGGSSCGAVPATAAFTSLMTAGNDLVVARVCSTYQPFFGQFLGSTLLGTSGIKLSKTIYQRPRLNLALDLK